ncbi:cell wall protein [Nocardioides caldifontis]|uniref:cell wall protein n=1 Tax=Nocardioides caldifontis TaxID=2588938 RepID=UPI0011DFD1BE|nr:cell wall protein [Nocardioides caldifontis]
MLNRVDTPRLRRPRILLIVATLVLALVAMGTYLASATTSRHVEAPPTGRHTVVGPREPASTGPVIRELSPIRPSSDPEAFAIAVAEALFEWDTAEPLAQTDYIDRVLAVADPTGEASPGLVNDIANYLPSPAAWGELRQYRTRQWIDVTSSEVPDLWPQALAEAGRDGLLPGTAAHTIEGLRHRAGVWGGEPVSSEHDVAFTVFVVCGPSYRTCHLLRLSLPDQPLE